MKTLITKAKDYAAITWIDLRAKLTLKVLNESYPRENERLRDAFIAIFLAKSISGFADLRAAKKLIHGT